MIRKNKVIFKGKRLEGRYGQSILASACYRPTKKERFSVGMMTGKGREAEKALAVKVGVLLRLRKERGGKESKAALGQYVEGTAHSPAMEKNLRCIPVRLSSFDEREHKVCGKRPKWCCEDWGLVRH